MRENAPIIALLASFDGQLELLVAQVLGLNALLLPRTLEHLGALEEKTSPQPPHLISQQYQLMDDGAQRQWPPHDTVTR
jgi:hypothetical protein